MISYEKALELTSKLSSPLGEELVPLSSALGRVLTSPVHAKIPSPPFTNSAMDGFAFAADDYDPVAPLTIIGEIYAAKQEKDIKAPCEKNRGVKIMTGAPLPTWADTVVPVEQSTSISKDKVQLTGTITKGSNIRGIGEDLTAGELLFAPGLKLTPERLSIAASLGLAELPVRELPRIGLFSTGDELTDPGLPLSRGAIYDSNSYFLSAAVRGENLEVSAQRRLSDDGGKALTAISSFLRDSDAPALLITTGAVSAGDKDFIPSLAQELGFSVLFHKVAVRPGKPIMLATKDNHVWVGIPGNPISTMTSWHFFLKPVLKQWAGVPMPSKVRVKLAQDVKKPEKLRCFYRAFIENKAAVVPPNQGSAHFRASLVTNGYVELPEGASLLAEGTEVDAILIE